MPTLVVLLLALSFPFLLALLALYFLFRPRWTWYDSSGHQVAFTHLSTNLRISKWIRDILTADSRAPWLHVPVNEHESRGLEYLESLGLRRRLRVGGFIKVVLPPDWSVKPDDYNQFPDQSWIFDQNGCGRGSIVYNLTYPNWGYWYLKPRYGFDYIYDREANPPQACVVVRDFRTGAALYTSEWSSTDQDKIRKLHADAETWLNESFSGWADPTLYWDAA